MTVEVTPYAPRTTLETLLKELPTSSTSELDDKTATTLVEALRNLNDGILTSKPVWRDCFALTGSLRTFYAPEAIIKAWTSTCASRKCEDLFFVPGRTRTVQIGNNQWIDVQFAFNLRAIPAAHCRGVLSLICDQQGLWKIWMIRTVLDGLEEVPSVDKITWIDVEPDKDTSTTSEYGSNGTKNASRANSIEGLAEIYDCVIVGAGQAGLSSAGRLQALGISSYIILERNAEIGDNWMNRYDSTKLHTPREYSHLPFDRTFAGYQEYLTKYDLARGHQRWARRTGVDQKVWCNTNLDSGSWDEQRKIWTLHVAQAEDSKTIQARNIIMAVGACGQIPVMPNLPGRLDFQGIVLHSADYKSSEPWKGKTGIVVGTANTAHDVAEDMVRAGLTSIIMVQRGRTFVLPVETYKQFSDFSYNTEIPTSESDFEAMSTPYAVSRLIANTAFHGMARQQPARFDALEAVGFRVERYGDIWYQIGEKSGGHYIDVGCSKLISDGLVSGLSLSLVFSVSFY